MDIQKVQEYLKQQKLDGWLMVDFHARNDVAVNALELTSHLTRRACYFIPAKGEPTGLVNPIEAAKFKHLKGRFIQYKGYAGLEAELAKLLKPVNKIAMEYSPMGRLPYIGLVDAGTIELVRSCDVEIVTSADLVANFLARLSPKQIVNHRRAAGLVTQIKDAAFSRIAKALAAEEEINEYQVTQFILERFEAEGLVTDSGPNCSVDQNAGDSHYEPTAEASSPIKKGSLVLIDLWARLNEEHAIYADITWMAYAGTKDQIPEAYVKKFEVLARARDRAVEFLNENLSKRAVGGYEADDACRAVIVEAGYGELFTHRTGHSIAAEVHGQGPNIDNLETEDRRVLQPGHLFSIEPGLYCSEDGLRTEIDCLITETGAEVTTRPLQQEILPLF
jgi:Xaa-Pro aminopeptidase